MIFSFLFLIGIWAGLVATAFPHLDELELKAEQRTVPSVILASDGHTVLRRIKGPTSRTYLEIDDLPNVLSDAVIAAEDRRFRTHSGIDLRGILRAARADFEHRSLVEGGSTITQQLVKNTYVGADRSLARKTREAAFAVALETRWSKPRILTTYLNTAYFGNGHYGVVDAAQGYFDKRVQDLKPAEAALLAALLRSPEGASPTSNRGAAKRERSRVLNSMVDLGMLTPAERVRSAQLPLPKTRLRKRSQKRELTPYVSDRIVGELIERYGVGRALGGGLRVRSTIDVHTQKAANQAVKLVEGLGIGAVLVAVDPQKGDVRAISQAGEAGRGAFDVAFDGHRQPGSAFKPFMLAAAYNSGYAPTTPIESAPFLQRYSGGKFRVTNDGGYSGMTTLEHATWASDNTVFARLQARIGIDAAITQARAAGIQSRMDPVPALVLGALPYGTTPVEMAHAYSTFAAHGVRTSLASTGGPRLIGWVTEPKSRRKWRPPAVRKETMPRQVADLVTATLEGVITQGTGFGANIGRPAAGKTGTTEEYRDAWFVGYTPDLAAAVWVGNVDAAKPMRTQNGGSPVTGGSIPASIWRRFMREALKDKPSKSFDLLQPKYVTVNVDPENGLLSSAWCAHSQKSTFIAGLEPTELSKTCLERDRPLPNLVGFTLEDARAELRDDFFEVEPTVEEQLVTATADDGVVIKQQPSAGTRLFRDEPIKLIVGNHPFA